MSKKTYCQYFRPAYKVEFPTIKEARKGKNYAFCNVCVCDFVISHGGRSDIVRHIKSDKHESNVETADKNLKVNSFFQKCTDTDTNVIRSECLFTKFLVEHNIPITAADHAGPLFRKMFPDSDIAKKYACARTKTSCIIKEMATHEQKDTITILQNAAYSLAVDGSNDNDSKLYPMVVTYFNKGSNEFVTSLLSIPSLEDDSTGRNISSLILNELNKLEVPFENCIAFCCDNAAVMLGKKNGVATFLQEIQKELITVGCPCHLINLAAEKAAATLPINVDQILVDVFYYLEKSAKRKEDLKKFQKLHCDEIRKILKHVCTRWLSLGRALARFIEQWDPLLGFFHEKVKSKPLTSSLSLYQIPKIGKSTTTRKRYIENSESNNSESRAKKMKCDESTVLEKGNCNVLNREENIFLFLSSDMNKVFCHFVLNTLPSFEETNVALQSSSPKIPYLNRMLSDLLKELFVKFVKPSVVKSSVKLTDVPYHNLNNQKDDDDLIIGTQTTELLKTVKSNEKSIFYCAVRKYFVTACDYIVKKFPINSDVLLHAEVADLKEIEKASFNSIKYFVEKFPFLLTVKDGESHNEAMDELHKEFLKLQLEQLNKREENYVLFSEINNMVKIDGCPKYDRILKVLAAILSIPHSNAECERIFSMVKKNRTQFRSNMDTKTLENILILKCKDRSNCYQNDFSPRFLSEAKKATVNSLMK